MAIYSTWVKIRNEMVSAARLDRLYTSRNMRNRVRNSNIFPTSMSDHKFVTIECTLLKRMHKSHYWHFNAKLLEDSFLENFKSFWESWKSEKNCYENCIQWWEIGKVQIKKFCQQFLSRSSFCLKKSL